MDVSIVVPLLNEKENILPLCEAIERVMGDRFPGGWEIILVDDGSTDGTWERIKEARKKLPHVRGIRFTRNFGQTHALSAGFAKAKGDVIVTIDGDLQNDPEDIPSLLEKIKEGFDVVSGWRIQRKDPWLTRVLPSRIANWLISRTTGVELHDYGCTLKAYRKEAVKSLHLYGQMHRFIPALIAWEGGRITEIPVNHHPRRRGKSKYGLWRTLTVILDVLAVKLLTDYASKPLYFFGMAGLGAITLGIVSVSAAIVLKVTGIRNFVATPLPLLSVFFTIAGLQFIFTGLFAQMLQNTHAKQSPKPLFKVAEEIP